MNRKKKVKVKNAFLQFPLSVFLVKFPDLRSYLPADIDLTDPDYFVRIDPNQGIFEFGYLTDKWYIGG